MTGKIVGPHPNTTDPDPLVFILNIQSVSGLIVRHRPQHALSARAYLIQKELAQGGRVLQGADCGHPRTEEIAIMEPEYYEASLVVIQECL